MTDQPRADEEPEDGPQASEPETAEPDPPPDREIKTGDSAQGADR